MKFQRVSTGLIFTMCLGILSLSQGGMLFAQASASPGTSGSPSPAPGSSPSATQAPTASPSPSASPLSGGSVGASGYMSSPTPMGDNSMIGGNWKVDRAIFELFGNLKDVTGSDERFYSSISFSSASKGSLTYGTKPDKVDMEFDLKNNSALTIAYGSRLKPQVDLYQVLILADGSLFLRSTRLAQVNGTVYYVLHRGD